MSEKIDEAMELVKALSKCLKKDGRWGDIEDLIRKHDADLLCPLLAERDAWKKRAEQAEEELSHTVMDATAVLVEGRARAIERAEKAESECARVVVLFDDESRLRRDAMIRAEKAEAERDALRVALKQARAEILDLHGPDGDDITEGCHIIRDIDEALAASPSPDSAQGAEIIEMPGEAPPVVVYGPRIAEAGK